MGGNASTQGAWARIDAPSSQSHARPGLVALHELRPSCTTCMLRGLCLPLGLDAESTRRLDDIISSRMRVRRKANLFRPGDRFTALYAIRLGTFKSLVLAEDGREQITGYHLAGEVLGVDGVGDGHYTVQAVALEDSEVCVIPFAELDRLAVEVPRLRHNLYRLVSRDLCREHNMMLLLGSRPAEERLTLFLL